MISYELPLEQCPNTYNGRPLAYAVLAATPTAAFIARYEASRR